jgi:hypothetical protein
LCRKFIQMLKSTLILTLLFCIFIFRNAQGQLADTSKQVPLVDVFDILKSIRHGKVVIDTTKTESGKALVSVVPGLTYNQLFGFAAVIEANISFFMNPNTNISVIRIKPEITQKKQFIPMITTNFWTKNNRFNFVSNWRYYDFSVEDFGMGGGSLTQNVNFYNYKYLLLHQAIYKAVVPDLLIGIGYDYDNHYKIKRTNEVSKTNAESYGIGNSAVSSGFTLNLMYDTRRNENSPVAGGWLAKASLTQNSTFLKSSTNYSKLYIDLRHYVAFPRNSKNILSFWNLNWFTFNGKAPYFDLPSSLWDIQGNTGRTYIKGRFRGNNMLFYEAEYRLNLLKNEFLGASIFANAQSFTEPGQRGYSKLIPGYGGSLKVKVNKKSKVYLITSYGFGVQKSHGFSLSLGEYF